MSYHMWHKYGYGIRVEDLGEITLDRFIRLLDYAPAYKQYLDEELSIAEINPASVEDYLEFDEDNELGLASAIQTVIWEAEGIELLACTDMEGVEYLIFPPSYPWEPKTYNGVMTTDRLDTVFRKYCGILSDAPIEIDYQSVENGG